MSTADPGGRTVVFASELQPGVTVIEPCRGPRYCRTHATTHAERPTGAPPPDYEHRLTIVRFSDQAPSHIRSAIVMDEDGYAQGWQAGVAKPVRVLLTVPASETSRKED